MNLSRRLADGSLESIPQVANQSALFESLPTARVQAKPESGLLVCRVELNSKYAGDFLSRPDPGAVLRVAGQVLFYAGPNGTYTGFFSVPKLSIPVGEDVEVELLDFDLIRHDYLGQFGTPFDGLLPLSLKHPTHGHRLDCRFLDAAGVGARIKPLLPKAKRAVKAVRKAKPNLRLEGLGYASTKLDKAWAAVDSVAAFGGWEADGLAPLAKDLEQKNQAWFKAAEATMTAQLAKLRSASEVRVKTASIQAWAPKVTCKEGAVLSTCELQVQVLRRRTSYLPRGIRLVDAQGMEYALAPSTQELFEEGTPAHMVRERWTLSVPSGRPVGSYAGPPGVNPGSRYRILQVCERRPACWLPID